MTLTLKHVRPVDPCGFDPDEDLAAPREPGAGAFEFREPPGLPGRAATTARILSLWSATSSSLRDKPRSRQASPSIAIGARRPVLRRRGAKRRSASARAQNSAKIVIAAR